ncbi:MAG: GlsB/YeaQ/YmgE family stress response membrane protein [Chloroflexota bacterium]
MGCLVLLVVLAIVLGVGSIIAVGFTIGLLFTLVVAGLVGWAADLVVPGRLPGGWFGAVLSGIVGGFIGTWLFRLLGIHDPGFTLFRVDLIPAFVGAVVIAGAAQLLSSRRRGV